MTTTRRTRLTPQERRTQLLHLGVELFATRSVEDISIDVLAEEAGVSRGLLYHYFGNKAEFREAVIKHAVDDLFAQTAPPEEGEPLERLLISLSVYVDYVLANQRLYRSLVRAAAGGTPELEALYAEARRALTDRMFSADSEGLILVDTPRVRLLVHGWAAMTEAIVLEWAQEPAAISREELLDTLATSLPALISLT